MKSKKRVSVWCRHFLDTWCSPGSVWSRVPGKQQSAATSPCHSSLFTACPLWLPSVYCGRGWTATYRSAIKSPFQIKSSLKSDLMWIHLFVKSSTDGTRIGQNCERGLRMILARFPELRNWRPRFWVGALPLSSFVTIWKWVNITYLDHKGKALGQCFQSDCALQSPPDFLENTGALAQTN